MYDKVFIKVYLGLHLIQAKKYKIIESCCGRGLSRVNYRKWDSTIKDRYGQLATVLFNCKCDDERLIESLCFKITMLTVGCRKKISQSMIKN